MKTKIGSKACFSPSERAIPKTEVFSALGSQEGKAKNGGERDDIWMVNFGWKGGKPTEKPVEQKK